MDTGLARYHRPGLPRPDRFTDHVLGLVSAGWPAPEPDGALALLEALRRPPTGAELRRRAVVVPRLAAMIRSSPRPRHGRAAVRS